MSSGRPSTPGSSPPPTPPSPASGRTDPAVHKRYLEYRERHGYFGSPKAKLLTMAEFVPLDAEHLALDALGEDGRDDEEVERWTEVAIVLYRD